MLFVHISSMPHRDAQIIGRERGGKGGFLHLEFAYARRNAHGFIQAAYGRKQAVGPFFHIGMGKPDDARKLPVADARIETVEADGVGKKHGVGQPVGNMELEAHISSEPTVENSVKGLKCFHGSLLSLVLTI